MAIEFDGKTYLVGPEWGVSRLPASFIHIGTVRYGNDNCPIFKSIQSSVMVLKTQPLNSQWPVFYPLKTQSELLNGWH